MITDPALIPTLPSYKKYEAFFEFEMSSDSLKINLDPLNLSMEGSRGMLQFKLTNKKKYSFKPSYGASASLEIGVDNMEDLNKKFLQGLRSYFKRFYEILKYDPVTSGIYLQMVGGEVNNELLKKSFIDLYKTEPMMFSKYLTALKSYDADLAKSISQEIGEEDVEDLRKGSSLLGKFGIE